MPSRTLRFDPMSGTWPMVTLNVLWVVGLTTALWLVADAATSGMTAQVLVYMAASGALLLGITGAPLRYFLLQQRAESARRETLLSIEADRPATVFTVQALDFAAGRADPRALV